MNILKQYLRTRKSVNNIAILTGIFSHPNQYFPPPLPPCFGALPSLPRCVRTRKPPPGGDGCYRDFLTEKIQDRIFHWAFVRGNRTDSYLDSRPVKICVEICSHNGLFHRFYFYFIYLSYVQGSTSRYIVKFFTTVSKT